MDTLLEQIKAHAVANYENGYDFIVECYSDDEILQECAEKEWTRLSQWTAFYSQIVDIRADRIADAAIEGGEW